MWFLAELLYVAIARRRMASLSRLRQAACAPVSPTTARILAHRVLTVASRDPSGFLRGWFRGAPAAEVRRGNFLEWLAWALFEEHAEDLSASQRSEAERFVDLFESRAGWAFATGSSRAVTPIRLTLDPVHAEHRPLVSAGVTHLAVGKVITEALLRVLGFRRSVDTRGVTFWYRAASGATAECDRSSPSSAAATNRASGILFFHGLGIGLVSYTVLLRALVRLRRHPILLVENPAISMRLTTPGVPGGSTGYLGSVAAAMAAVGMTTACVVAHSFGTVVAAWMMRQRPDLVHSTVLIDPIPFLLCLPDVCNNFVHRPPTKGSEMLMRYFVSRDATIAATLARHFHWRECCLWADELPGGPGLGGLLPRESEDEGVSAANPDHGMGARADGPPPPRATVVLSSADAIIPAAAVRDYLALCGVRTVWLAGLAHAGFLGSPSALAAIVQAIDAEAGGSAGLS